MSKILVGVLAALAAGATAAAGPDGAARDAAEEFLRRAAEPEAARCPADGLLVLAVDPGAEAGPEAVADAAAGLLRIRYPMAFKQITEGWNWHPEAAAAADDYYRYKYVPLKSVEEDRGAYRFEDKIGEAQEMRVRWRYDYFAAFDNPYDFYVRSTDDEAGFALDIPWPRDRAAPGDLRMAVAIRLQARCLSDSTTFYKATYGKPVDFTLKKRYVVGRLEEVRFYEAGSGRVLGVLRRGQGKAGTP